MLRIDLSPRFGTAPLASFVALGLAGPAGAQTVPHKEKCYGHLTGVTATTMDFVGVGNATHMGRYRIVGGHTYTPDGDVLDGTFTSTAADGSTISGTYEGTFTPLGGGLFRFEVSVEWSPGTGRLAGVTGVANVTAILDMVTGQLHYDTLGTWTFP